MAGAEGAGGGFAGFGARAGATQMAREAAQRGYESAQESAQRDFESQTLADLAMFEDQDVEFRNVYTAPADTVTSLPTTNQGTVVYNGEEYEWDPQQNTYRTVSDMMSDYYDDDDRT